MCQSRWSKCDISYEHLYLALSFLVEALMNGNNERNLSEKTMISTVVTKMAVIPEQTQRET